MARPAAAVLGFVLLLPPVAAVGHDAARIEALEREVDELRLLVRTERPSSCCSPRRGARRCRPW